MWEDTEIKIGYRESAPDMSDAEPSGPAVHVGPYRTFFNRHVSITIPYSGAGSRDLMVCIYNHVLDDWDLIEPESVDTAKKQVTFNTQVLGLFQAGRAGVCPAELIYGKNSQEVQQLKNFRDNVLSKTAQGRAIIKWYYDWSPAVVKGMKEAAALKEEVKKSLDGVLLMLR
jgi:hypothetical protein